jgi:hypothetical protein
LLYFKRIVFFSNPILLHLVYWRLSFVIYCDLLFFVIISILWPISQVLQVNPVDLSFFCLFLFQFHHSTSLIFSWLWIRLCHLFWFVLYEIISISWPGSQVLWVNPCRLRLFYGLMTRVDPICCRLNIFKKYHFEFFFVKLYLYQLFKLFLDPLS